MYWCNDIQWLEQIYNRIMMLSWFLALDDQIKQNQDGNIIFGTMMEAWFLAWGDDNMSLEWDDQWASIFCRNNQI